MKNAEFRSFGDLYRAAYAETNAERKMFLLSEVRRALDEWERSTQNAETSISPKTSQLTDLAPQRAILAA